MLYLLAQTSPTIIATHIWGFLSGFLSPSVRDNAELIWSWEMVEALWRSFPETIHIVILNCDSRCIGFICHKNHAHIEWNKKATADTLCPTSIPGTCANVRAHQLHRRPASPEPLPGHVRERCAGGSRIQWLAPPTGKQLLLPAEEAPYASFVLFPVSLPLSPDLFPGPVLDKPLAQRLTAHGLLGEPCLQHGIPVCPAHILKHHVPTPLGVGNTYTCSSDASSGLFQAGRDRKVWADPGSGRSGGSKRVSSWRWPSKSICHVERLTFPFAK